MKSFAHVKTVIINRAVPGSGKSSIARAIAAAVQNAGLSIATHSTDDYFMHNGRYCFDIRHLHEYHMRNFAGFRQSLRRGIDVVVCDNTNLVPWQTQPYTDSAREFGYQIIFLNLPPRELWKHRQAQLITPQKPDAHNVPLAQLAAFIRDFKDYNPLLEPNATVDPSRQHHFVWDAEHFRPVAVGTASRFDCDAVVTIPPDQYHEAKENIGARFLHLLQSA